MAHISFIPFFFFFNITDMFLRKENVSFALEDPIAHFSFFPLPQRFSEHTIVNSRWFYGKRYFVGCPKWQLFFTSSHLCLRNTERSSLRQNSPLQNVPGGRSENRFGYLKQLEAHRLIKAARVTTVYLGNGWQLRLSSVAGGISAFLGSLGNEPVPSKVTVMDS